jgi:hypothetical protein
MYSAQTSNVDFGPLASLRSAADVNNALAQYPGASGAIAATHSGKVLHWPAALQKRFPPYPRTQEFWLMPKVGDGRDDLLPVLVWWVLQGLSLLARYEPAAWRSALDLDRSPIADGFIYLLDAALEIVPDLLYEAATVNRPSTP